MGEAAPPPSVWLQEPEAPLSRLLVLLFREVCERQARLVAEWLRVGYCQGDMTSEGNSALTVVRLCHVLCHDAGNMNSDNSALCGVTLDYGPFGFLERFDPMHCPWVGGGAEYSFGRQPQAHLGGARAAVRGLARDASTALPAGGGHQPLHPLRGVGRPPARRRHGGGAHAR